MDLAAATALVIGAYLLGSIPFALVIGGGIYHTDVRKYGSGNIGTTNVFRVLGIKAGVMVFAGDFLKGYIPTFLATLFSYPGHAALVSVIVAGAAIVGHTWSIFLRGKGGKGGRNRRRRHCRPDAAPFPGRLRHVLVDAVPGPFCVFCLSLFGTHAERDGNRNRSAGAIYSLHLIRHSRDILRAQVQHQTPAQGQGKRGDVSMGPKITWDVRSPCILISVTNPGPYVSAKS